MRGDAVRLEISDDADERFVQMLVDGARPRTPGRLSGAGPGRSDRLHGAAPAGGVPRAQGRAAGSRDPARRSRQRGDMFDVIRAQDVLVHHPYESFGSVVDFIEQAADDPQVLAIKQTLYRTSGAKPDHPRAGAGGAERQAGHRAGRAQGPVRRGEQHRLGPLPGAGRRARGLWRSRTQDPLQGGAGGAPRGRWHPTLRAPLDRQLQPHHRQGLHRPRACSPPSRSSARTPASCSTCSPAIPRDGAGGSCWWRRSACESRLLELIDREGRNARGRPARPHHREDECAGRADRHRCALSCVPGRRTHRSGGARHLLPAARASRACPRTSG